VKLTGVTWIDSTEAQLEAHRCNLDRFDRGTIRCYIKCAMHTVYSINSTRPNWMPNQVQRSQVIRYNVQIVNAEVSELHTSSNCVCCTDCSISNCVYCTYLNIFTIWACAPIISRRTSHSIQCWHCVYCSYFGTSVLQLQPIADRVAQNLEIIFETFSTNQNLNKAESNAKVSAMHTSRLAHNVQIVYIALTLAFISALLKLLNVVCALYLMSKQTLGAW